MSKVGDIVFAWDSAWVRRPDTAESGNGMKDWWWKTIDDDPLFMWHSLNELKESDNFRWLIKDGDVVPNYDTAVEEYEELINLLEQRIVELTEINKASMWPLSRPQPFIHKVKIQGAGWTPSSATQVEPDSSRSKWGNQ